MLGALLDLREDDRVGANSKRGLLLPRVELEFENQLKMGSLDITNSTEKVAHIGLVVYNTAEVNDVCPGIYVWTQDSWRKVGFGVLALPVKTEHLLDFCILIGLLDIMMDSFCLEPINKN